MSQKEKSPRLELKLNLSPPQARPMILESPNRSMSSSLSLPSPTSPPSSCVSSEVNSGESDQGQILTYSDSPKATPMVLVGCPRCLMYVMLAEEDPRCPKCKSTVLLDFLHESEHFINNNNSINTNTVWGETTKKTW